MLGESMSEMLTHLEGAEGFRECRSQKSPL